VTNGAALLLDKIDESAQRRRQQAVAGVIEKWPREAQPPWFENGLKGAALEMRAQSGAPLLTYSVDAMGKMVRPPARGNATYSAASWWR
jgi:hypothetical protein